MQQFHCITYRKRTARPAAKTIQKINKPEVQFVRGQWQRNLMYSVCKLIYQWRCEKLLLYFNRYNKIISNLLEIKFPTLKHFNLQGNNICTIQPFCRMWLPCLENLQLCKNDNRIWSMEEFKKTNWPKIKRIQFRQNMVIDCGKLSLMWIPNLEAIVVEEWDDEEQSCDLRWVGKLETAKLTCLCKKRKMKEINSEKRIDQKEKIQLLQKYNVTSAQKKGSRELLEDRIHQQLIKLSKK